MPVEAGSGSGSANDATVIVENNVGALEDALAEARAAQEAGNYQRRVDAAETKVQRQEEHLAAAKEALAAAKAELKENS